jgi:diguanylate cyclase (GGDEF)-like protein
MSLSSLPWIQALLPRRIHARLALAIFLPLALAAVAGLVGYSALREALSAQQEIRRLDQIAERIEALWQRVLQAQSGLRGFALSGDETFLDHYRDTLRDWPAEVDEIDALLAGSRTERSRLDEIGRRFDLWRSEVAEIVIAGRRGAPPAHVDAAVEVRGRLIAFGVATSRWQHRGSVPESEVRAAFTAFRQTVEAARRTAGRPDLEAAWQDVAKRCDAFERVALAGMRSREADLAAADLVRSTLLVSQLSIERGREALLPITGGQGNLLVEEIRALHEALVLSHRGQLERRLSQAALRGRVTTWAAFGGWAVAALLGLAIAVAFARRMLQPLRSIADAAGAIAAGDLQRRAELFADDEVGRLAAAFNGMAERLERRDLEVSRLHELSQLLQTAGDEAEAFEIFERLTPLLLPGASGAIHTISASRIELAARVRFGPLGESLAEVAAPQDCWALRQGRTYVVDDVEHKLVCAHLGGRDGLRDPHVCLPLVNQGETIGLLHVSFPARSSTGGELAGRVPELEGFANALALALGNLGLREKLRAQSVRDPLTGLFNRRYLEETLPRELDRCRRREQPLVLAMADLDHFKKLNDSYGHEAGDRVLQRFAEALRRHFRSEDVICRYGGEEFCFVLPDCPIDRAKERCASLLAEMRETIVTVGRDSVGPVTVTIGLAQFGAGSESGELLLRRADAALYAAKRAGRDRVLAAAPLAAPTAVAVA